MSIRVYKEAIAFRRTPIEEGSPLYPSFCTIKSLLSEMSDLAKSNLQSLSLSAHEGLLMKSSVIPSLPESPLVMKAGLAPLKGSGATSSSPQKATLGDVRMKDGKQQVLQVGPSGKPRWMSPEDVKDNEGPEQPKRDEGDKKDPDMTPEGEKITHEEVSPEEKERLQSQFKAVKFEDATANIKTHDGKDLQVEGKAIGGLLVHLDNTAPGVKKWAVSHMKSGAQISSGFGEEEDALMATWRLAKDYNWDRESDILFKDPQFNDWGAYALRLKLNPYAKPPSQLDVESATEERDKRRPGDRESEKDIDEKKTPQKKVKKGIDLSVSLLGHPSSVEFDPIAEPLRHLRKAVVADLGAWMDQEVTVEKETFFTRVEELVTGLNKSMARTRLPSAFDFPFMLASELWKNLPCEDENP